MSIEPQISDQGTDRQSTFAASGGRDGRGLRKVVGSIGPVWRGVAVLLACTTYFSEVNSSNLVTFNLFLLAIFGAVALNMLMGTAGLVSIGNSAFLAVGAFVTVYAIRSSVPPPFDVLIAVVVSALVGVVIGLPALRLRGLHLFLATLAGYFIVLRFAQLYQSRARGEGASSVGFFFQPTFESRGLQGAQVSWAWTLFALVAVLVLAVSRITTQRCGRAWRMIRDHEPIAHTLGIPVVRYKVLAFAISSGIIGLQGSLAAHLSGSVTTDSFTFELAISYIAMVIIGGLDSIIGAVVGAAIVTVLPVLVPHVMAMFISNDDANARGPALSVIVYGALIVCFVVAAPRGMAGLGRDLQPPLSRVADRGRSLARSRRRAAAAAAVSSHVASSAAHGPDDVR